MYQKPGYYEVPNGVSMLDWANTLYNGDMPTLWETNVRDFFKDMSKTLNRKTQFLQLEDVVTAKTDRSPARSAEQLAFAHLATRWMHSLGLPGVREYPAVISYARTPFLTFDDCVDRMLTKHIVFPSWNDIGNKEARLEEIVPIFIAFIRSLVSLRSLRPMYASRLRTMLADIGYRNLKNGDFANQFEKSFFVRFSNPRLPWATSRYLVDAPSSKVGETSDPKVHEAFNMLQSCVEAGPITRFGLMVSNRIPQELFAFFGPYTSTLQYTYGMPVAVGPFVRFMVDEQESIPWSLEEQEDAIRASSSQFIPRVSSVLLLAKPYLVNTPLHNAALRNSPEATWPIGLDAPETRIRMNNGFNSRTHNWDAEWWSPTRGRQVSTARGGSGSVFMQDLAQSTERFGGSEVGPTSLSPTWALFDAALIDRDPSMKAKINRSQTFTETIIVVNTATASIETRDISMERFYVQRDNAVLKPAFSEYLYAHRNALRVEEPAAESYIYSALNLSRAQQRRSANAIRMSHRWAVLKRLFDVEVMPFDSLVELIKLEAGLPS